MKQKFCMNLKMIVDETVEVFSSRNLQMYGGLGMSLQK